MSDSPTTIFDFDFMSLPMSGVLAMLFFVFLIGILIALFVRILDSLIGIENTSRAERRERFRKAKLVRTQMREANFRQQLQKPTFESRLQNFARGCQRNHQPVSKMKFWQAEDLELKYVPAKPIELIRMALIRLSKLFYGK